MQNKFASLCLSIDILPPKYFSLIIFVFNFLISFLTQVIRTSVSHLCDSYSFYLILYENIPVPFNHIRLVSKFTIYLTNYAYGSRCVCCYGLVTVEYSIIFQGLYSLSGRPSFRKISRNLEASRFGFGLLIALKFDRDIDSSTVEIMTVKV